MKQHVGRLSAGTYKEEKEKKSSERMQWKCKTVNIGRMNILKIYNDFSKEE